MHNVPHSRTLVHERAHDVRPRGERSTTAHTRYTVHQSQRQPPTAAPPNEPHEPQECIPPLTGTNNRLTSAASESTTQPPPNRRRAGHESASTTNRPPTNRRHPRSTRNARGTGGSWPAGARERRRRRLQQCCAPLSPAEDLASLGWETFAHRGGVIFGRSAIRSVLVLLIPQFCPHRPRPGLLCKTGQPLV